MALMVAALSGRYTFVFNSYPRVIISLEIA